MGDWMQEAEQSSQKDGTEFVVWGEGAQVDYSEYNDELGLVRDTHGDTYVPIDDVLDVADKADPR